MATYYLDFEAGNDANTGASFAQRVKSFARASALVSPGDTVRVMAAPDPVSLGVNTTWNTGDYKVTLASAVNADVDGTETNWTASANVTCTRNTTSFKEGSSSQSIAVAAGFTTGLAAYKAMSSTDFSGYQQISFWIQQSSGTLAANCSIRLCSDNAGVTTVNTFTIPALLALNAWTPVVINLGSAMGSTIQSVAFYVDSDQAAQTFIIDNMVACKAVGATGELTHQHLIGKAKSLGAGGDDTEYWMSIGSIRGTTVTFDTSMANSASAINYGRYFGATETVAGYGMKQSILTATAQDVWNATGTPASRLAISGGWDRTAMSSQTGQSWLAMPCSVSQLQFIFVGAYIDITRLHFARSAGNNYLQFLGVGFDAGPMHICGAANPVGNSSDSGVFELACTCCSSMNIGGSRNSIALHAWTSNTINLSGTCSNYIVTNSSTAISGLSYTSKLTFGSSVYGEIAYDFATAKADIATSVLGVTIEGTFDMKEILRVCAAESAGKTTLSGSTYTLRNLSDTKNVITATIVGQERTAVTYDVT